MDFASLAPLVLLEDVLARPARFFTAPLTGPALGPRAPLSVETVLDDDDPADDPASLLGTLLRLDTEDVSFWLTAHAAQQGSVLLLDADDDRPALALAFVPGDLAPDTLAALLPVLDAGPAPLATLPDAVELTDGVPVEAAAAFVRRLIAPDAHGTEAQFAAWFARVHEVVA